MPQDVKPVGAVRFTAAGQEHTEPCRIIGVIWVGTTTAGDTVRIQGRGGSQNAVFWPAQTDSTNTFLGAIWGAPGLHAPDGFRAATLSAGEVFIYLSE